MTLKLKKEKSKPITLPVLGSLLLTSLGLSSASAAEGAAQPLVSSRVKANLRIDGKKYRDLNGNSTLDTYEN